jgi:glycosyltransferase involved in cell wall biosynthesis
MWLSVVLATRNRCSSLKICLGHLLFATRALHCKCEVIVVDNGSTDDTRRVVSEVAAENPGCVRYLFEGRVGKSLALNTAIAEANGDVLAFTDDDCYVSPSWLKSICVEFEADESLGGLGGRVELYDTQDYPVSTRTGTERVMLQAALDVLSTMIGCNMAFRRALVEKVGGFDCSLGPGTAGIAAEDMDFVYRIYKAGAKIAYVPEAVLYHNHGRRTAGEVDRLTEQYVRGKGAFYCKHVIAGDRLLARVAYWEIWNRLKKRQIRLLRWLFSGIRRRLFSRGCDASKLVLSTRQGLVNL